jgi:hypothetical protein
MCWLSASIQFYTFHKIYALIYQVERNGNKPNDVCGVMTLEELVAQRPDDIIQTNNDFKLL